MNYAEAIKRPACGYKYMSHEQEIANLAKVISRKHCLRPMAIFEWAKRHKVPLIRYMPMLMDPTNLITANSCLLEDILNDEFEAVKTLLTN